MVRFLHPNRPTGEQVNVWCEQTDAGFRLVRREPDGDLYAERCASRVALYAATVRLQTALTRSGWLPAGMIRIPVARRRATRAAQFHR